ncbi:MAG: hypothetical protein ACHQ50_00605 [Fimbriimonadales bacterium]
MNPGRQNVFARLAVALAAIAVAAQAALTYHAPGVPLPHSYVPLMLLTCIAAATLGAIGYHRGSHAWGLAAIIASIAAFMWPA